MLHYLFYAFSLQVADMQVELEELQPQLVETAAENEKMLKVCYVRVDTTEVYSLSLHTTIQYVHVLYVGILNCTYSLI